MTASARKHMPGTPSRVQSLRERQAAFVAAYVASDGRSASAAARQAGYPAENAHIRAHRLLRRDYVLAAISAQPGGRAVLERLAARSHSPYIAMLARLVLHDDGTSLRVGAQGARPVVYIDRSAAALREQAIAHRLAAGGDHESAEQG